MIIFAYILLLVACFGSHPSGLNKSIKLMNICVEAKLIA